MKHSSRWALGAALTALTLLGLGSIWVRTDHEDAIAAPTAAADPVTGAILVDLEDGASSGDTEEVAARIAQAIAPYDWPSGEAALGAELSDEANLYRISPPASEVADVLRALRENDAVEAVEIERTWSLPDWRAHVRVQAPPTPRDDPDRFQPNDPYYPYQWHLDQIGMPEAWLRARGEGVVVAVIDTGVAYRDEGGFALAPDLGQTGFVDGWDFVDNDAQPDDEHGHGTHVAGTIAQSTHNGVGVAGVAPSASIMPLRVLDRNGSGGWGAIAAAIRFAADNGANVINMSLGGGLPSRAVQRAIDHAHERGVLVIAAAGNSSRGRVEYPGAHDHVLAVGAVRYDRTLSFYSNWGTGLDLVAPGGDLRVDQNEDGMPDGVVQNTLVAGDPHHFDYLAWQGTSMATPHVAGAAALVYGAGVRDPDSVQRILAQSALDLGDANRFGSGLLQAQNAVRLAQQGTGAARGTVALALSLLVLFGLRRRGVLAVRSGASAAWSVALAGGLGVIPFFLLPSVGGAIGTTAALGPLGVAADFLGPYGALAVLTVGPAFALVALGLHVARLRAFLVGASVATASFLTVEALWPTQPLAVLPELAAGPWLLLNAVLALGLAALVARRAA